MALPDDKEIKATALLRERMKDVLPKEELEDDLFLLRWIRARDLDLDKAEAMLRNALKWRSEKKVDTVLERKIDPFFFENYPRWIGGVDKEGRPLYCAAVGKWDLRTVVRESRSDGFLEYTTEGFEQIMAAIKKSNLEKGQIIGEAPVTQCISIFDFDGFAWSQLLNYKAVQELLSLASIYEAFYPEILHSCYFINSPSLISAVLKLLTPILAPKTMAKIHCLSTNREEWEAELSKVIDVEQRIPMFGGIKEVDTLQQHD